eukprot:jgi/Mesvir1/10466/Mv14376-RA.1
MLLAPKTLVLLHQEFKWVDSSSLEPPAVTPLWSSLSAKLFGEALPTSPSQLPRWADSGLTLAGATDGALASDRCRAGDANMLAETGPHANMPAAGHGYPNGSLFHPPESLAEVRRADWDAGIMGVGGEGAVPDASNRPISAWGDQRWSLYLQGIGLASQRRLLAVVVRLLHDRISTLPDNERANTDPAWWQGLALSWQTSLAAEAVATWLAAEWAGPSIPGATTTPGSSPSSAGGPSRPVAAIGSSRPSDSPSTTWMTENGPSNGLLARENRAASERAATDWKGSLSSQERSSGRPKESGGFRLWRFGGRDAGGKGADASVEDAPRSAVAAAPFGDAATWRAAVEAVQVPPQGARDQVYGDLIYLLRFGQFRDPGSLGSAAGEHAGAVLEDLAVCVADRAAAAFLGSEYAGVGAVRGGLGAAPPHGKPLTGVLASGPLRTQGEHEGTTKRGGHAAGELGAARGGG